jgi:hypothetical protein
MLKVGNQCNILLNLISIVIAIYISSVLNNNLEMKKMKKHII